MWFSPYLILHCQQSSLERLWFCLKILIKAWGIIFDEIDNWTAKMPWLLTCWYKEDAVKFQALHNKSESRSSFYLWLGSPSYTYTPESQWQSYMLLVCLLAPVSTCIAISMNPLISMHIYWFFHGYGIHILINIFNHYPCPIQLTSTWPSRTPLKHSTWKNVFPFNLHIYTTGKISLKISLRFFLQERHKISIFCIVYENKLLWAEWKISF